MDLFLGVLVVFLPDDGISRLFSNVVSLAWSLVPRSQKLKVEVLCCVVFLAADLFGGNSGLKESLLVVSTLCDSIGNTLLALWWQPIMQNCLFFRFIH